MDLKSFKAGIDYLAKATNQRLKEPEPFMLQVGKDNSLSLIAGDTSATYVWRTGIDGEFRIREGVSSKLLVQAAKMLKGKVDVNLVVEDDGLVVTTSAGGRFKTPFVDSPELLPPAKLGEAQGYLRFPEGRLPQWVDAFKATSEGDLTCGVQFLADRGRLTIVSTEAHKAFVTYMDIEADGFYQWGTPTAFWMPLRGATTNGDVTFRQLGLQVRSQNFEAYSAFTKVPVFDPYGKFFQGKPEVMAVTTRKTLLDGIKGITTDEKDGTIDISLAAEGALHLSRGVQHIGLPLSRHKGWGRIGIAADYLTDVLNAMDGKEVILAWHERESKPLGIKDTARQGDIFVIAPRVKV